MILRNRRGLIAWHAKAGYRAENTENIMDEQKFEGEMLKAIMRRATGPNVQIIGKVSSVGCNGATTEQHSGQTSTIDSGCRLRRTAVMSRIANTGTAYRGRVGARRGGRHRPRPRRPT